MKRELRVLLIEDSADDAALLARTLSTDEFAPIAERVDSSSSMSSALERGRWDIVLCDYSLPGFGVGKALDLLRQFQIDAPLLVVSGTVGEETAAELMRLGAADVILKANIASRLSAAVKRELAAAEARRRASEAAKALSARERQLQSIAESIPGLVYRRVLHRDGSIVYPFVAGSYLDELGMAPIEWPQNEDWLIAFIHPDDRATFLDAVRRSAVDLSPLAIEVRLGLLSGAIRWMHCRSRPRELDGSIVWDGVAVDTTERHSTEARLHELQLELLHVSRLSTMQQTGSVLAHELNQPLSAITNYVQAGQRLLALNEPSAAEKVASALEKMGEQAARAGQIIQGLREFSAKGKAERRSEDLARVIEEARALVMAGTRHHGVVLTCTFDPAARSAFISRIQVQQVLVNLTRNAIEAMAQSERRELTISTTLREGDLVEIGVADTGPGLAEEVARQLFKPFVTTKADGMGVGLSICQTIIGAHGGRIWVTDNPGGGTIFHFTLPSGEARDDSE